MSEVPDNELIDPQAMPRHVAVIMDGNGRWAKKRMMPRLEGHRAGAKSVRMIVEECRRLGIKYLTLYAFSTENWDRPKDEVSGLMRLFEQYLRSELAKLLDNGIRLRAIGDLSRIQKSVREHLQECEEATKSFTEMELILAISYGGRRELTSAVKQIAMQVQEGDLSPEDIDESVVQSCLYAPEVPDPDLLIRTSDEHRISNFLLWQLAYSEILVTPVLWPDFSKDEFYRCLVEYSKRDRRYGLTESQQVSAS